MTKQENLCDRAENRSPARLALSTYSPLEEPLEEAPTRDRSHDQMEA
ncbi:MAG: hypothetical protein GDA48_00325 [Hormoscilla sp. GM102CHS1]|nr:hypothetical protein [Hormoscilla sp. GM102CHS1]